MKHRIKIRCRLPELLKEKGVTAEELAVTSGLAPERISDYCGEDLDAVSLGEASRILSALNCARVTDLFEEVFVEADAADDADTPPMYEAEWDSPCPAAADGRHRWYKDTAVSDTVYQEFTCQACKRKLSVIL